MNKQHRELFLNNYHTHTATFLKRHTRGPLHPARQGLRTVQPLLTRNHKASLPITPTAATTQTASVASTAHVHCTCALVEAQPLASGHPPKHSDCQAVPSPRHACTEPQAATFYSLRFGCFMPSKQCSRADQWLRSSCYLLVVFRRTLAPLSSKRDGT